MTGTDATSGGTSGGTTDGTTEGTSGGTSGEMSGETIGGVLHALAPAPEMLGPRAAAAAAAARAHRAARRTEAEARELRAETGRRQDEAGEVRYDSTAGSKRSLGVGDQDRQSVRAVGQRHQLQRVPAAGVATMHFGTTRS